MNAPVLVELTMTFEQRLIEAAKAGKAAFYRGKGGDPHEDSRFWDLVYDDEGNCQAAPERQRVHVAWVDGWITAPQSRPDN